MSEALTALDTARTLRTELQNQTARRSTFQSVFLPYLENPAAYQEQPGQPLLDALSRCAVPERQERVPLSRSRQRCRCDTSEAQAEHRASSSTHGALKPSRPELRPGSHLP